MTQVSTPYVRPSPTTSPPASKAKVNTVQEYRIPITTEILKSVILKPPGERIFKTKVNKAEKVDKVIPKNDKMTYVRLVLITICIKIIS
jgi:hypothetical protein